MTSKLEKEVADGIGDQSQRTDSDSGHEERTTSSSASCSSEAGDDQDSSSFVDAIDSNDNFILSNGADHLKGQVKQEVENNNLEQPGEEKEDEKQKELKVRLQETAVILKMALNNEFIKALDICSRRADKELYASLATATLSFLRVALTLEPSDMQAAVQSINQSFEVSSRRRRKQSTASMMMRFLYRPNYNSYTDDEVHAELVHAESLLLLALISFLSDQSIICLVRGAFRIRTCYQRYKECLYIMENRLKWESDEARRHFESGVRMGHGVFNLLMSYLPRRVLKFLEYVGFSGNRSVGVDELDKSMALDDGLRSVFSTLVILTYHSYVESLFGLGSYDSEKVEQVSNSLAANHPNSAFYLLFRGRFLQMDGQLDEAIKAFEQCIEVQQDWKQFHSICHWEIMWCYAVQMDWPKAAHYSDLLRKRSKWSVASYTYQYATFLYAQLVEDERHGRCPMDSAGYSQRMAEIRGLMEQVPDLRIRYAGKTIPAEKFAITRSIKFCQQNNRLSLPALEFLYIWNIFVTLKNSPQQVERLLDRIDAEIEYIGQRMAEQKHKSARKSDDNKEDKEEKKVNESSSSSSSASTTSDMEEIDETNELNEGLANHWIDDLSLMLLLRGMCFKHLNRLPEAEECFMEVVDNESSIQVDTFLVPHTSMELALLKLNLKQYDDARQWVKRTRNQYTGYLLETIVHFRLHAASRIIRLEQQDLCLNSSGESTSSSSNAKEKSFPAKTVNVVAS